MTAFLNCPFCGSSSLDATCAELEHGHDRTFYYVFCEQCEASGPTDYNQRKAIELWNTRREPFFVITATEE